MSCIAGAVCTASMPLSVLLSAGGPSGWQHKADCLLCSSQANPFGSAKPVDTVARLKELEERDAKRKVLVKHLHNNVDDGKRVQCSASLSGTNTVNMPGIALR